MKQIIHTGFEFEFGCPEIIGKINKITEKDNGLEVDATMDTVIGKLKEDIDNLKEENRILKIKLSLTNSILENYETNISANNLAKDIQNKLEDKEIDKYTPVIILKDKKYIVGVNARVCNVNDLVNDSSDKGYDCEDVTQRYSRSHDIVVLEPRKCKSDENEINKE